MIGSAACQRIWHRRARRPAATFRQRRSIAVVGRAYIGGLRLALGSVDRGSGCEKRGGEYDRREKCPTSYAVRQSPKFHVSTPSRSKPLIRPFLNVVEQVLFGIRILARRLLARLAGRVATHRAFEAARSEERARNRVRAQPRQGNRRGALFHAARNVSTITKTVNVAGGDKREAYRNCLRQHDGFRPAAWNLLDGNRSRSGPWSNRTQVTGDGIC